MLHRPRTGSIVFAFWFGLLAIIIGHDLIEGDYAGAIWLIVINGAAYMAGRAAAKAFPIR